MRFQPVKCNMMQLTRKRIKKMRAPVSIYMSLVFVVRYHFEKSAITACRGNNTLQILYSTTVEEVFDPTHKYHGVTITQTA